MTPKQQKILDLLQEECGEVIVAVSKLRRWGPQSMPPEDYPAKHCTNREALAEECGDVLAIIRLLIKSGLVTDEEVEGASYEKIGKLCVFAPEVLL
jgi:NTP pyrophosphatase (non-canonical NTP hydrolase)